MTTRVLSVIPVLLIASILIFIAMRVLPGDPVSVLAQGTPITPQQRAALTQEYHLDESIPAQYVAWLGNAVTGDLGTSLKSNQPVTEILGRAIPRTLLLLAGAFIVSLLISLPLGLLAALREGRPTDQLVISLTMLLFAVPLFITCVLAIYVFSYQLDLFPAFGLEFDSFSSVVQHMILPWITLGLALVAAQTATLRAGLVDALHQDYIVMAQSRGIPWRTVLRRHALRSALVPVVTLLGVQLSSMIVGSVFVDYIFGLGGLGSVLVNAVSFRDLPLVQASVLLVSAFFILANLAVDLVAARLDPRYAVR
ncbi:ABC transporter permease [Conexibacter sp. CPCC 206217]|uniref:ABC transporter permease n=1 Tax=Conexibacter sp. CPCC 206217 TaxID=3064574 RepID=UPI00272199D3|nr:ABC transporter permease [Conexibacter sp. CPCC 206217]MDO8212668.1 ABC transporter permease [Conexibacter sp. CPCC 206217]